MKIIRKYAQIMPAQLAKIELASHGIESAILDEAMAEFNMYNGIRLAVADEDESEAEAVLDQMQDRELS